ncbi:ABC transporter ATP-binding protein [Nonomuraea purpurea]|uniref:ABC transporter ATP-binding protein n=1 Tax=Nonomuraea purpurea TaxID=1849276 RepID=A0ABV8G2B9_9ACTN
MLEIADVTVRFGGVLALDRLSFSAQEGRVCALIGPNGAGKTTLFNVVSRVCAPESGRVVFAGQDLLRRRRHRILGLGAARTFQNLALWPSMSVRENVMTGAHIHASAGLLRSGLRLRTRGEEQRLAREADELLASLDLAEHADHPATGLPFGTLKRVELARALMGRPRLLLLDEPAGGLTHPEVDELVLLLRGIVAEHALTVLLVEHHMGMIMRLSDQVVVLDSGRKIADGPPDEVRNDERVVAAYLGAQA